MSLVRRIGVSLGNLVDFHDGLGEFSRQIGERVAARAPQLRAQGVSVSFHLHPRLQGCFGPEVEYLAVHRSQEFWHTQSQSFDVWHTLNQLNRYPAPRGTRWRILTVHDLNFLYFKRGFSRFRDLRRLRAQTRRHDEWVAISDYVQADVKQHTAWAAPSRTIYNGAADLQAQPQTPVAGLEGQPFLLHLSRMSASKNVEAILEMVQAWPEQNLVLAGPDAARNEALRARCAAMGMADRVQVLTRVSQSEKAWLYAHCRLFLFPSLTEGFGLPPIEAMHFGKPVVLSDRTCLPEIGGPLAHYATSPDAQGLRQACEQALQRPHPPHEVRAHALRFSWARCAEQSLQIWLDRIQQAQAPIIRA
jgi:glycosyltransferase involved in cell wall biosynthesis